MMGSNPGQQAALLGKLTDGQLQTELQTPTGSAPVYLIMAEMQKRAQMRQGGMNTGVQGPQSSVRQQMIQSAQRGGQAPMMGQQDLTKNVGPAVQAALAQGGMQPVAPMPMVGGNVPPMSAMPNPALPGGSRAMPGYANGGMVQKFDDGGMAQGFGGMSPPMMNHGMQNPQGAPGPMMGHWGMGRPPMPGPVMPGGGGGGTNNPTGGPPIPGQMPMMGRPPMRPPMGMASPMGTTMQPMTSPPQMGTMGAPGGPVGMTPSPMPHPMAGQMGAQGFANGGMIQHFYNGGMSNVPAGFYTGAPAPLSAPSTPVVAPGSSGAPNGAPDPNDILGQIRPDPAGFFSNIVGAPVSIHSGQRTPSQNAAAGGSPTSEHLTNSAWDFSATGLSNQQVIAKLVQSGIPSDQIIDEGNHVHFGIGPKMRNEIMAGSGDNVHQVGSYGSTSGAGAVSGANPSQLANQIMAIQQQAMAGTPRPDSFSTDVNNARGLLGADPSEAYAAQGGPQDIMRQQLAKMQGMSVPQMLMQAGAAMMNAKGTNLLGTLGAGLNAGNDAYTKAQANQREMQLALANSQVQQALAHSQFGMQQVATAKDMGTLQNQIYDTAMRGSDSLAGRTASALAQQADTNTRIAGERDIASGNNASAQTVANIYANQREQTNAATNNSHMADAAFGALARANPSFAMLPPAQQSAQIQQYLQTMQGGQPGIVPPVNGANQQGARPPLSFFGG